MASSIADTLKEKFKSNVEELGYELVDVEYVKENSENYLRFFIYNKDGTTIDDCERCSLMLDPILDELDLIKDFYYLEVSTPDLNRPLKTDDDLRRNLGVILDVSLYRKIEGKKEYRGKLISYNKENIVLELNKEFEINRKDISNIKVAIIF